MQCKDDKHHICYDHIFSQEISIKSVTPKWTKALGILPLQLKLYSFGVVYGQHLKKSYCQ